MRVCSMATTSLPVGPSIIWDCIHTASDKAHVSHIIIGCICLAEWWAMMSKMRTNEKAMGLHLHWWLNSNDLPGSYFFSCSKKSLCDIWLLSSSRQSRIYFPVPVENNVLVKINSCEYIDIQRYFWSYSYL